nr:TonB-dependent receptor [Sphingobium boeckii]
MLSSPVFAQGEPLDDAAGESGLIIVTAARAPITSDQIASSVTVLDKPAIDASQAIIISDVLVRATGVTLTRNGGYGTATGVRIRGAESDQTVVVIDGVKLNDPSSTGGGYNFANLFVGDTAQIEILRGPQSILWGSQAIGGVVNIVTASPEKSLEGSFDVEAGSRQTFSARAGIGGVTGPVTWRLAGNAFTTDGISALSPRVGGVEPDRYTDVGGNGRVNVDLGGGAGLDLRGYYGRGRVEIDSTTRDTLDYSTTEDMLGYSAISVPLLDGRWRNRLAISATQTDRDSFGPTRARPQSLAAHGTNRRYEYQGGFAITQGWDATFGLEREESRLRTYNLPASLTAVIPTPTRGSARLDSLYGQLIAQVIDPLTITAGVRHDDHDRFGGNTVFGGGAILSLFNGNSLIRGNYAEGFKAPTLYQLQSEYGNAALKPETSEGWEAGLEQRLFDRAVTLSATYYARDAENLIVFYSCSGAPAGLCLQPGSATIGRSGYYDNVSRTRTQGVELGGSVDVAGFALSGNYSWIDAEDRSPGATLGKKLRRLPRNTANGSIGYAFGFGLSLAAAVRWSGKAFENAANTQILDDYTLIDLRAALKAGDGLEIYARAENLFDEYYETARNYNTLGRSIHVGLRGRF